MNLHRLSFRGVCSRAATVFFGVLEIEVCVRQRCRKSESAAV